LEHVVAHARALGEVGEAGIPGHLWAELRDSVVSPLCRFLAESEPFRDALLVSAQSEGSLDQQWEIRVLTIVLAFLLAWAMPVVEVVLWLRNPALRELQLGVLEPPQLRGLASLHNFGGQSSWRCH